jgi:hypothetical protein
VYSDYDTVRVKNRNKQVFRILIVSAALRAALTAELIGPRGPLPRFVFRINIKIKDAKPRRALIRASLTNRWSGSPLHSVAPSARLHYADSAQLRRYT